MFTEDLDVFFNDDDFATDATLQTGFVVSVIFDRAVLDQLGIAGTSPQALAKASEVTTSNVGQTITIAGTAYTIERRDLLDDGATVLLQLRV